MDECLKCTEYVDFTSQRVQKKCRELFAPGMDDTEKAKISFEFVRDEIPHSYYNKFGFGSPAASRASFHLMPKLQ